MAASVPELTRRTFSTLGTIRTICSASSTSPSVGAPKEVPLRAASPTASRISGSACPNSSGPQDPTKST